jgi:2-C-methyl-D-erythritol 4-phosphate cytidylyltransferase
METIAIIPAGGKGTRSGLKIPKQFIKVNGKELISYTLNLFQKNSLINKIIIPAPEEYVSLLKKITKKYRFSKVISIIPGGKERQNSVFNALTSHNFMLSDLVVVHDAARPLLPVKVLTGAIKYAKKIGNAVVAVKARDTLAEGKGSINAYLPREIIYYIQTPQIFRYSVLKNAFDIAIIDKFIGTDESMLVHRTGEKVHIYEGSYQNIKITTKEDIDFFKKQIS